MSKKMTKEIRAIVEKANKFMQTGTLEQNEQLFDFISSLLLERNMYKGFNLYVWAELENGDRWLLLAGGDKSHRDEEGRFIEQDTDIRQFYLD